MRGQPASAASHSASVTATSTAVTAASVATRVLASCQPSTSAAAGNIGRMYDGSFEPEMLKKTKTKAAHTRQNLAHAKPPASIVASRQPWRRRHRKSPVHGRNPATNIGAKYHHAPVRRCSVVRKRSKCSWMKKKRANSGLRSDTRMNHGAL